MKPRDFVIGLYPMALQVEQQTGVFAVAILTRAAIESGWGDRAVGNNFFGIKDTDGINGNEQLMQTTEYIHSPKAAFPVIFKIIPFGTHLWKYIVKDYFRKYDSIYEGFLDFAQFLQRNERYHTAIAQPDALTMGIEICKAGYATDPKSIALTTSVTKMIEALIPR